MDKAGLLVKPGCPPPRELQWEDLKALPYLTACAKEAMRMLPVVSVMGRAPNKDMKVGPYMIPAGALMWVWVWVWVCGGGGGGCCGCGNVLCV